MCIRIGVIRLFLPPPGIRKLLSNAPSPWPPEAVVDDDDAAAAACANDEPPRRSTVLYLFS